MHARLLATVLFLALLDGCVPLPVTFYVGDASVGRLSYDSCSLGVMPAGLFVSVPPIELLVDVRVRGADDVVHVRYDVPHGHDVRLVGRAIVVDPRDGSAPRTGTLGAIDFADRADPDGWPDLPARRASLHPVDTPMDGTPAGRIPERPLRHYWIATRVATGRADPIWVRLPDLTVDGRPVAGTEVRFDRHSRVVLAPINC